jgi:hypothetical protein
MNQEAATSGSLVKQQFFLAYGCGNPMLTHYAECDLLERLCIRRFSPSMIPFAVAASHGTSWPRPAAKYFDALTRFTEREK